MLKRVGILGVVLLAVVLQGCASLGAGLQSYADSYDGYEFLYPTGWVEVRVPGGPDVVFHDIINETENVSVVISEVPEGQTLQDLGTPTEVGYKLAKSISAIADTERTVDLLNAEAKTNGTDIYYFLEYDVSLPSGQARHNYASAIVRRGKLFTFNASTLAKRWDKMGEVLQRSVESFSVY